MRSSTWSFSFSLSPHTTQISTPFYETAKVKEKCLTTNQGNEERHIETGTDDWQVSGQNVCAKNISARIFLFTQRETYVFRRQAGRRRYTAGIIINTFPSDSEKPVRDEQPPFWFQGQTMLTHISIENSLGGQRDLIMMEWKQEGSRSRR
jgi:hypothetical protein